MTELYSTADVQQAQARQRHVLLWMGGLTLPLLAGIVVSFVLRIQWLTIGLTALWLSMLIFLWDLKLSPARAYLRFVTGMLGDLYREMQGSLSLIEKEPSLRDGLEFYRLLVNIDPEGDPEGERQLFFDARKPRPAFALGQEVHFLYRGNEIRAYALAAQKESL